MDEIGFLCASLGRSKVQGVADAHAYVQRLVSVVKMAMVLVDVLLKSSVLLCVSCGQKDSMQRILIKKFPVYNGNCLSRKAVHNWFEKFSQGLSKIADDARSVAEVAEATVKRLLCYGFRRTDKAMGQLYHCLVEEMPRNKCFFPCLNITCFMFYIHL
jgi:hypothetical protein